MNGNGLNARLDVVHNIMTSVYAGVPVFKHKWHRLSAVQHSLEVVIFCRLLFTPGSPHLGVTHHSQALKHVLTTTWDMSSNVLDSSDGDMHSP